MYLTLKKAILILIALVFANVVGCGSKKSTSSVVPQPPDNPGTGNQTIYANVTIFGLDFPPGSFTTTFSAVLIDTFSQPITNATVTVSHASLGTIVLAHDSSFPGNYRATASGYQPGRYNLRILRGTDSISGAYINASDMHNITFPTLADTLAVGASFEVRWSRSLRTDTAEVSTRDFGPAMTADDSSYTVSTSPIARNDQRVRVWRHHTMPLAGGTNGSEITVTVRNGMEPVVVQ